MSNKISRKQFELAVKAVTSGVYYSAFPDKREALQEVSIEDLGTLREDQKEKYITLREFGKDLYFTYPPNTEVDDIITEYVDSVFEFIKENENK